jgi:hypothetical protein
LVLFRDAWVAAAFARARNLTAVSLVKEVWPDFIIRDDNGRSWGFEATEALEPDRRRDYEYRGIRDKEAAGLPTWKADPAEEWLTPVRAEQLVSAAFQRKIAKQYPSDVSLIIYLNASAYGTNTETIEAAFLDAIPLVQRHFQSVWILWEGRAYLATQSK